MMYETTLPFAFLPLGVVVGIATSYGLDDRGSELESRGGVKNFLSPRPPDWFWGPPNFLSNGYWGFFPLGVKRQGCEADHSPPTSIEAKKMWIYTSTPHTPLLRSAYLVKHRDTFFKGLKNLNLKKKSRN
jgi:hypothetical protein